MGPKKFETEPGQDAIKEFDCTNDQHCSCNGEPFNGDEIKCPNIAALAKLLADETLLNDSPALIVED